MDELERTKFMLDVAANQREQAHNQIILLLAQIRELQQQISQMRPKLKPKSKEVQNG